MQSKAATVEQYLASLPEDRRAAVSAVRKVILENLDKGPGGYAEGMTYGMIGYYVPHSVFPPGYHCDPKQPLSFAGLASQKQHMSIYLMCIYGHAPLRAWFEAEWKKTGKKLDMGKACIRFKKVDDLALDVLAQAIRRVPAKKYIETYVQSLASMGKGVDGKPLKNTPAKPLPTKPTPSAKPAPPKKPTATKKKAAAKATKAMPPATRTR